MGLTGVCSQRCYHGNQFKVETNCSGWAYILPGYHYEQERDVIRVQLGRSLECS